MGIRQDRLLRRLGVGHRGLLAGLGQLTEERLVRVHWPFAEAVPVFSTG